MIQDFVYMMKACRDRNPERAALMTDFLRGKVFGHALARTLLELCEPMDHARCSIDAKCDWTKDRPVIYDWLRQMYAIPAPSAETLAGHLSPSSGLVPVTTSVSSITSSSSSSSSIAATPTADSTLISAPVARAAASSSGAGAGGGGGTS